MGFRRLLCALFAMLIALHLQERQGNGQHSGILSPSTNLTQAIWNDPVSYKRFLKLSIANIYNWDSKWKISIHRLTFSLTTVYTVLLKYLGVATAAPTGVHEHATFGLRKVQDLTLEPLHHGSTDVGLYKGTFKTWGNTLNVLVPKWHN